MTAKDAQEAEGQEQVAAPPAEAEGAPARYQQQMCGQKKQQLRESECGSQQGDAQGEATAQEQTHTVATQ